MKLIIFPDSDKENYQKSSDQVNHIEGSGHSIHRI